MKQFKKVIGWIGTIIGAPFYFLDKAANFYGKKKFIEISMILVMGVFVWAFIYNMKGEKITASYFFIGIPLYIIGWCSWRSNCSGSGNHYSRNRVCVYSGFHAV